MILRGKTALITGGSGKIGREIAIGLAEKGVNIVVHCNISWKDAEKIVKYTRKLGVKVDMIRMNFENPMEALKKIKKLNNIDILINNASSFSKTPIRNISEKKWDEIFSVNLKTAFFLAKILGKKMLKRKEGKIINMGDASIKKPENYIPYYLSKLSLVEVTKLLAKSFYPKVQVNSISPAFILSRKNHKKMTQKVLKYIIYLLTASHNITGKNIIIK